MQQTRFVPRSKLLRSKRQVRSAGPTGLPSWISQVNGLFTYAFNVFNNHEAKVDQVKLTAIVAAITQDCATNFAKDYSCVVDMKVYKLSDMTNAALFDGSRLPIFIGDYGDVGGFHAVDTPKGPVDTHSFFLGGSNLSDVAPAFLTPAYSGVQALPAFTPYIIVGSHLEIYYSPPSNIYGISPTTVPVDTYHQTLSMILSHEVHETLSNDNTVNFVAFDHYAPMVANLKYATFDLNGVCTNGVKGSDSYQHLPTFLQHFPNGGMFQCVRENGDPVSIGISGFLQSYLVSGWRQQNYPLQAFWSPYATKQGQKYDHLGFVKTPMQPYAGVHELVFFTSFDTGVTYLLEIDNMGPITVAMRSANVKNNFPPDTTFAIVLTTIKPGTKGEQLAADLDYYGVKYAPDKI